MSVGARRAESGTQCVRAFEVAINTPIRICVQHLQAGVEWHFKSLLARLEGRASLKELEPLLFASVDCPVHGDIIEFHGAEGTGKTEMFCHLIARCILPKSEGGLQVEVIYIDTDYHFDMLRLVTILEHRLAQSNEETVKECLSRLFLVCCNSSVQLLLTLYSLENMFCSHPTLCLLIIDSLSSFYWIDRNNGGDSIAKQESNMRKCIELLDKLLKEYKLVLFASTQTLMQKFSNDVNKGSSHSTELAAPILNFKPYLCKLWQQVTTHRIRFSKDAMQPDNVQTFSITSNHLKTNSVTRHTFVIGDFGVKFIS